MSTQKILRLIGVSSVLVFAVGVFNIRQDTKDHVSQEASQRLNSATESTTELGSALVWNSNTKKVIVEVAGNAPCNPEQEVCNK